MDSINWIKYLKNNHHKLTIIPTPNHINLYPNMNYNQPIEMKSKLANQIKEITLVWNKSYEERCELFKKYKDRRIQKF